MRNTFPDWADCRARGDSGSAAGVRNRAKVLCSKQYHTMVFKRMQAQMVNYTRALPQWVVFVTGFQAPDRTGLWDGRYGGLQTKMP